MQTADVSAIMKAEKREPLDKAATLFTVLDLTAPVWKAGRLFLFNADNVASDEDQHKDELVVTHIAPPPTYRIGEMKNVAAIAYQRFSVSIIHSFVR